MDTKTIRARDAVGGAFDSHTRFIPAPEARPAKAPTLAEASTAVTNARAAVSKSLEQMARVEKLPISSQLHEYAAGELAGALEQLAGAYRHRAAVIVGARK